MWLTTCDLPAVMHVDPSLRESSDTGSPGQLEQMEVTAMDTSGLPTCTIVQKCKDTSWMGLQSVYTDIPVVIIASNVQ